MKPTTKKTNKTEISKTTAVKATAVQAAAPAKAATREVTVTTPAPEVMKSPRSVANPGKVTLQLVKPGASRVLVAGSFNGWRPEATPLTPLGNGRWTGSLDVTPGKYEYLFVVDGSWMPDPNATESVANPFGGLNSVLTVRN
jgi:1,4-alpha-glucan branching enzyme